MPQAAYHIARKLYSCYRRQNWSQCRKQHITLQEQGAQTRSGSGFVRPKWITKQIFAGHLSSFALFAHHKRQNRLQGPLFRVDNLITISQVNYTISNNIIQVKIAYLSHFLLLKRTCLRTKFAWERFCP